MHHEMIFAGFGGQGIMTMGTILVTAGMQEGRNVTWLPSYGAEQRGGTANCTVVVSDESIGSPIVDRPDIVVAMNLPSLDKFGPKAAPGGMVFVNSSLVAAALGRKDVREIRVPANELAEKAGSSRVANIVMLGALAAATGLVKLATLEKLLQEAGKRRSDLARFNLAALRAGADLGSSFASR